MNKTMIASIKKWITGRQQKSEAIQIARTAFHNVHPDEKLIPWRIPPVPVGSDIYIVTVCYSMSRPPHRSWWRVNLEEDSAHELPFDEATKLIRIPVWR